MTRISLLAAALGALVLAGALAGTADARGRAVTESASSGTVTARLSYVRKPGRFETHFSRLALAIERGGQALLSERIKNVVPAGAALSKGKSVLVRDLDRDGEPEVVVDLWTNGAHCCERALIYRFDAAAGRYSRTLADFGNPGYRLTDLDHDGRPEFFSADDRFNYEFTSYAFSGTPIRIWRYTAGALADVTRSYPLAIAADAKLWSKFYRHERHATDADVRGFVAAYVADEYLLRKPATGWRLVHVAEGRGELSHGYERKLMRFLQRTGYAPPA